MKRRALPRWGPTGGRAYPYALMRLRSRRELEDLPQARSRSRSAKSGAGARPGAETRQPLGTLRNLNTHRAWGGPFPLVGQGKVLTP